MATAYYVFYGIFSRFLGRKLLKLPLKRMICTLRIWSRIKILKASCQSVNLALYKQCKINFAGFHLVAFFAPGNTVSFEQLKN